MSDTPSEPSSQTSYPYVTHLNILFAPLEVVDVPALVEACTDRWYNQTLCKVNDSVVRLGVMQGEYHWHKHDDLDEFFYVVEGRFLIDLEERTVELAPRHPFPKSLRQKYFIRSVLQQSPYQVSHSRQQLSNRTVFSQPAPKR